MKAIAQILLGIVAPAVFCVSLQAQILSVAGDVNLFVGEETGPSNTGTYNTFVGPFAGFSNAGGFGNAFFGANAGSSNVAGYENAFFGVSAGRLNTDGVLNAFFGAGTGINNTSGCCNSFFGNYAGALNDTGFANSFFGGSAGGKHTTGFRNTFVGDLAGNDTFENTALETVNRNTFLGSVSGRRIVTGSNNTMLGVDSTGVAALEYGTALGSNAEVTTNDTIVIGKKAGTYHGIPRTADTVLMPGAVGVGTTAAPTSKLTVQTPTGQYGFLHTDTNIVVGSWAGLGHGWYCTLSGHPLSFFTGGSSQQMTLTTTGNLGIGTTIPDQRLSVAGNASKSAGGGSWAVFSDERLKSINGPFTRGIDAISQLQPIRFSYSQDNALDLDSGETHIGLSAQQVSQVIPEPSSPERLLDDQQRPDHLDHAQCDQRTSKC